MASFFLDVFLADSGRMMDEKLKWCSVGFYVVATVSFFCLLQT